MRRRTQYHRNGAADRRANRIETAIVLFIALLSVLWVVFCLVQADNAQPIPATVNILDH